MAAAGRATHSCFGRERLESRNDEPPEHAHLAGALRATDLQSTKKAIIEHAKQTLGRRRFRQLWARIGRRGRK